MNSATSIELSPPATPSSAFTPQQREELYNTIQYAVCMALTEHLTVTNPLSNPPIPTPTITCRRCLSNFSSKTELFKHVKARPRCPRIKSTVSLISPRAYPQHDSQHGSQHGVSTLSASTSSGYSGGTFYQAASSTSYTSDSDDEYEQELGLECELEHEQEQEVEEHVDWPQVDHSQEQDSYTYSCEVGVLEQDHACIEEGYNQGYDCGYDHGYDYGYKQDSYGDHDYEQDDYDYEPDDCEDNGYYSD